MQPLPLRLLAKPQRSGCTESPPPVIKRVISAVYMLLYPTRVTAPRFNVEWSGGPHSCQGLLGRRDFTAQIAEYDAAALCEHPALLSYVARNYIGEEGSGIAESASAAELSPVSSPVRGPKEEPEQSKLVSKSVVFGRRAGSPKKAPPSWKKAATMAKVTGTLNKSAADRRAARNADWAEVGYSDKVAPRRLSYDEVSYASKACGALYQWATTAVDTAKALEQLYPVKKECDALQERRDRLAAQLREAEERLGAVQKEETASEESVRKATAELERLRELLEKLKAEEAAKAKADAEAAKAKAQAEEDAAAKREAAVRRTTICCHLSCILPRVPAAMIVRTGGGGLESQGSEGGEGGSGAGGARAAAGVCGGSGRAKEGPARRSRQASRGESRGHAGRRRHQTIRHLREGPSCLSGCCDPRAGACRSKLGRVLWRV